MTYDPHRRDPSWKMVVPGCYIDPAGYGHIFPHEILTELRAKYPQLGFNPLSESDYEQVVTIFVKMMRTLNSSAEFKIIAANVRNASSRRLVTTGGRSGAGFSYRYGGSRPTSSMPHGECNVPLMGWWWSHSLERRQTTGDPNHDGILGPLDTAAELEGNGPGIPNQLGKLSIARWNGSWNGV